MLEMPNSNSEGSAMMITQGKTPRKGLNATETVKNNGLRSTHKDNLWCNYYKKKGHIKDNCWKLHGKPPGMGRGGGYKGNQLKGQVHLTSMEEPSREAHSTNQLHSYQSL